MSLSDVASDEDMDMTRQQSSFMAWYSQMDEHGDDITTDNASLLEPTTTLNTTTPTEATKTNTTDDFHDHDPPCLEEDPPIEDDTSPHGSGSSSPTGVTDTFTPYPTNDKIKHPITPDPTQTMQQLQQMMFPQQNMLPFIMMDMGKGPSGGFSGQPDAVSSSKPCGHNSWDNVRTKKGNVFLRCRVCDCQWRLPVDSVTRCTAFNDKTCNLGEDCPKLHLHTRKLSLAQRVNQSMRPGGMLPMDAMAGTTDPQFADMSMGFDMGFPTALSHESGMSGVSGMSNVSLTALDEELASIEQQMAPLQQQAVYAQEQVDEALLQQQQVQQQIWMLLAQQQQLQQQKRAMAVPADGISLPLPVPAVKRERVSWQELPVPCRHNNWDHVRTKKGNFFMRCRVCESQWRTPVDSVIRCALIGTPKGCDDGPACQHVHLHSKKRSLEQRIAVHGVSVLRKIEQSALA